MQAFYLKEMELISSSASQGRVYVGGLERLGSFFVYILSRLDSQSLIKG